MSPRIAVVLWNGLLGGAETFTARLARELRVLGADARVVFVTGGGPLAERLYDWDVPHDALGLRRGRDVVLHPRALAHAARAAGADGALLVSVGYLGAALRVGGYRGRIVSVAHDLLQPGALPPARLLVRRADRASGFWASDVEVAVSDYVLARIRERLHARRLLRIYNGVDLDTFTPSGSRDGGFRIGWAGRLVPGKGVDVLLRATALLRRRVPVTLWLAGDGDERPALEALARSLELGDAVRFVGWTDPVDFWPQCDAAAMPSDRLVESFGMAAVEAMASGLPVVASRNGALPELVADGTTGRVVPGGDAHALADALEELADPVRRRALGAAARASCEERFDIRDCAKAYAHLFE